MENKPGQPQKKINMDLPVVIIKEKAFFLEGKSDKKKNAILNDEIKTHEEENPDYLFDRIAATRNNADGSVTIAMGFKLSILVKE